MGYSANRTIELGLKRLAYNAIDVHCHGIGRFDFTEVMEIQLQEIEALLAKRHHQSILTLYLPKPNFDHFLELMDIFDAGKRGNQFKHISGIALEGPLLASHGGTPHKGVWVPSQRHWQLLSKCGRKGLVYVIFSPDADCNGCQNNNLDEPAPSVRWIAETLLDGGVLPAAGHFTRDNPEASAKALQDIFDAVAIWGNGPTMTDHLYNDMPHNFKHAWRSEEEKQIRDEQLKVMCLKDWNLGNIREKLGPVPATMIENALKGCVKIAMNFDGEHVDLAIVKKTVELVGAENLMMMTDSIESKRLAGRDLYMKKDSTLLYQDEGIVAAGSQGVLRQINNMVDIGLSAREIALITRSVSDEVLAKRSRYFHAHRETEATYV